MPGNLKEMLAAAKRHSAGDPKAPSQGVVTCPPSQMRSLSMFHGYDPEVVLKARFDSARDADHECGVLMKAVTRYSQTSAKKSCRSCVRIATGTHICDQKFDGRMM